MTRDVPTRIYLGEEEMPRAWYNLRADLPEQPAPMLHPRTLEPVTEADLRGMLCGEAARQELDCSRRMVEIPEGILDFYRAFRPSPLIRAYYLERALETPAEIYYKFEGTNTSGSHKLNSAGPQAFYAREEGLSSLATETGAGQWGSAMAMACGFYGLELTVFMVKVSCAQKPYRRALMESYGARVVPSPSDCTEAGRRILAADPDSSGSLGCAIAEAMEAAGRTDGCRYVLGSVLNHVMLHQTVIGLEAKAALQTVRVADFLI